MTAAVEKLADRRELQDPTNITPPSSKVPALGMSLQVDLGAGRVCTLQTFISSDCTSIELNTMLDKMTAAGARQRSAYKIEELERDLEKLEREQGQGEDDLKTIERDFILAQKKRQDDAESAVKSLSNIEAAVKESEEARGRRGPVELKGKDKANADRVRAGVEKLKVEMEVAVEEHKKSTAAAKDVIARRAQLIEKTRAEIVRCKEIVADGLKA